MEAEASDTIADTARANKNDGSGTNRQATRGRQRDDMRDGRNKTTDETIAGEAG